MKRELRLIRTGMIATLLAILAIPALVNIGGCSAPARNQQIEGISLLQPGRTTEQEAAQILGSTPISYTSNPDGSYIAVWQSTEVPFMAPARTSRVSVLFGHNNVMIKLVSTDYSVDQDKKITVK